MEQTRGLNPAITVVGSAVYDLVFYAERFPSSGETMLVDRFQGYPGGKGANQAVAIARLGGQVRFIGAVGADAFGAALRRSLEESGVEVLLKDCADTPSGCASIVVDSNGCNQIVVAPGANMKLVAAEVSAALSESPYGVVLTQLEIPLDCVEACANYGRRFILNPAPARPLASDILTRCYLVTPNENETEMLTGIRPYDLDSCRRAARSLLDQGAENVAITLGERGCFWMDASTEVHIPAPSVKAVDTVGAGDAFNGALALFLTEGREWPNALALATSYAALSVTKPGAQASLPTRAELKEFAGNLF